MPISEALVVQSVRTPNTQGRALNKLIDRNNLFVAYLGEETSGSAYTYCSGDTRITVCGILVVDSIR